MNQCYINLTIVRRFPKTGLIIEGPENANQPSPFSRAARLKVGRLDWHREISLQALFDPCRVHNEEVRRPSRILIRGRAGVVKTTLCKKIVHEFTYRKMWQRDFCRVLWIPLRNLKLRERCQVAGYNFGHLLSHEFFTESPRSKVLVDALWQRLNETKNEGTLLILDGLDEVSSELDGDMERFFEKLLNHPNVVITSRPHATLPPKVDPIDLEVETVGFHHDQVVEYVSKSFSDVPEIVASVNLFLQNHQLMRDLAQIPVQLDALCYVWKDLDGQLIPQTMTAIYRAIEQKLWKKDGVKFGKLRQSQVYRRKALEHYMADEIELLEALAFAGMYNDTVEFTQ
jgi:hypothetical protein